MSKTDQSINACRVASDSRMIALAVAVVL